MTKILTKEGAKLHLVTVDDLPICRPLHKSPKEWIGFEITGDMSLRSWLDDANHCLNCEIMLQGWAFNQFTKQIIAFMDAVGVQDFPIQFIGPARWEYASQSKWPDAKIIKGDGYKRR